MKVLSKDKIDYFLYIIFFINCIAVGLWLTGISDLQGNFIIRILRKYIFIDAWGYAPLVILVLCWYRLKYTVDSALLIGSLIQIPILVVFWKVAILLNALIFPCCLYTISFLLMFIASFGETETMVCINPTKYSYFNKTYFYFYDSRKNSWYKDKEYAYDKIKKILDGLEDDLKRMPNANFSVTDLIDYVRSTRCIMTSEQLKDTINKLDYILENNHLSKELILNIFEMKSLLMLSNRN